MLTTWTIWAAVVAVVVFLINWLTSPIYASDEPKPVQHWVPVLGHAISLARDKRALFKWAATQRSGPFSMLIGGRKHYIFSKPLDIAAIYRNAKTLDIEAFIILAYSTIFGLSKAEALEMRTHKEQNRDIIHTHLLNAELNQETAKKYFVELEEQFALLDAELEASPSKSLDKDGLSLIMRVQGTASTIAYFGRKMFEVNPEVLVDLTTFLREGYWRMMFGLPRFFYPNAYAARRRVLEASRALIDSHPDQKDISPFLRARFDYQKKAGWPLKFIASHNLGLMFGLNTNSVPTAYAALIHMITHHGLLDAIRAELTAVGYSHLTPSEYYTIIPSQVPRLRALWHETLRFHNALLGIREVLAPTTLEGEQTWNLEKGAIVTIPASMLHWDAELHPQPEEFRPERFLDPTLGGEGQNPAKGLKAFGGGSSYCPGRIFAEKQVIGTLAAFAMRYDLKVLSQNISLPHSLDFEYVTNVPVMKVEIKKRMVVGQTKA